ncbi:MAG: hypothetical protein ABFD76_15145 [Smithella sp.]
MFINGTDIYTTYGVTPLRGTYSALFEPVIPKAPLVIDIHTEDGERVYFQKDQTDPLLIHPTVQARSFIMPVALVASNSVDFFNKKTAFETLIVSGLLTITSNKFSQVFRCYLEECQQYNQLTPIANRKMAAVINLKLREINPKNRTV